MTWVALKGFHTEAKDISVCLYFFKTILKTLHEPKNLQPWLSLEITCSPRYLVSTQVPFHLFD